MLAGVSCKHHRAMLQDRTGQSQPRLVLRARCAVLVWICAGVFPASLAGKGAALRATWWASCPGQVSCKQHYATGHTVCIISHTASVVMSWEHWVRARGVEKGVAASRNIVCVLCDVMCA